MSNLIKRNYVFNLLITGFNILYPVISFPYASKILGPVGIGKVQLVVSFSQYFALIATLGIPIYGIRVISQSTHDLKLLYKNLGELLSIHIICTIVASVLYLIVIFNFQFFKNERQFYLLSGFILLLGFTSVDWYFYGLENFKLIALRLFVVKAITLFLLFFFIRRSSDVKMYLIITILSFLGSNLYNFFTISKNVKFSFSGVKNHLKPLMFTFGTIIATSMYTILDTLLIGFLTNEKYVGLYSAAIRLTKTAIPVIISLAIVLVPKTSKLFGSYDYESLKIILDKSFSFISVVAVPICFGLVLLAPQLIYALSGKQFVDAILTMQILAPLVIIIGYGYFWGFQILIPGGREKELLISVSIGMIFNIILNLILIPRYKQNGAAVANVVSETAVTLSYMYFSRKVISFKISHKPLIESFIASIPLVFTVLIFKMVTTNIYYQIIFSSVSFISIYALLQIYFFKNSVINEFISGVIKFKR